MNYEKLNKLLDELDGNSLNTLKTKNDRYATTNDCLHNFITGSDIMGGTPAQCAWGYMTKHLVALRDKVQNNDFHDRDDLLEKCQDIINYIRFIWLIGNEERGKYTSEECDSPHVSVHVTKVGECDSPHVYEPEKCAYYKNGRCMGTKEMDFCNYKSTTKTCRLF